MDRLRAATRADHEAVEALVGIDRPDLSRADYTSFLEVMLAAHEPFEAALGHVPAVHTFLPDLRERLKTAALRADLHALGRSPAASPSITLDLGEALGGLYVLEGSTLGARFVLARVRERLGHEVQHATSYLEGYGEARATRWQGFVRALEHAAADPDRAQAIVRGAVRTFAHVRALFAART